ncbi:MAG: NCS2 family permease [bacterium]|nr:NCS2 family permease [bacterium]
MNHSTKLSTEILAGFTTFVTMAYIIFVNPVILGFAGIKDLAGAGLPFNACLTSTCLSSAVLCILMGSITNYPIALASGMGLNAVVAYDLVLKQHLSWPGAMGVIVLEGILITLLVITQFRIKVMDAIPLSLKKAISVGIGLFLTFIGLVQAGIVKTGPSDTVPVTLGNLDTIPVLVAVLGIFITSYLISHRVKGALLLGIIVTTILSLFLNHLSGYKAFNTAGTARLPDRILGLPDFSLIGKISLKEVFIGLGFIPACLTIFSVMLSDFFDTMGTVIGLGTAGNFISPDGKIKNSGKILLIDSLGAVFGGFCSSSSVTTYIESAAGIKSGGRTGITAIVTGILFLVFMFFYPVIGIVPAQATAPALIIVGFLMMSIIRDIPFDDFEEAFPSFLIMIVMPMTYSITNGIGLGFIVYTIVKMLKGKFREVHLLMYIASLMFIIYFLAPLLNK